MSKKSGFTLIELLITISIIAILSIIGLVAYSSFMQTARNNKRQSDLKLIQSALEDYHSDLLFYPTDINSALSSGGLFDSSTGLGSGTAPTVSKTYLNNMPKDPTANTMTSYCYVSSPAGCTNSASNRCLSYNLYAKLENPPSGASSYSCSSQTYNFQVTPP